MALRPRYLCLALASALTVLLAACAASKPKAIHDAPAEPASDVEG